MDNYIDKEFIATTYSRLIDVHKKLGMNDDEIQKQLTVYGRAPFQIHEESWDVNGRGAKERFLNDEEQVVIRLDGYFCQGNIDGDIERIEEEGIILLSDDRTSKYITCGFLEGFQPKPKGEYPITEAFQILVGDFTIPWETKDRMFFKNSLRWNYIRMFKDNQFALSRFVNRARFEKFGKDVRTLEDCINSKGFTYVKEAHDFLGEDPKLEHLCLLFDCGLLKYYNGNFASGLLEPDKYPMDL